MCGCAVLAKLEAYWPEDAPARREIELSNKNSEQQWLSAMVFDV
jgi:hypothetical protein